MRGHFKLLIFLAFSVHKIPSPTTDVAPPLPKRARVLSKLISFINSIFWSVRKSGVLRISDQTAGPRTQLRHQHDRLRLVEKEAANCPRKVGPIAERAELSVQE